MPAAVSPDPQPQPGANDDLDDLFADLIGNDASNHAGLYSNERTNNQTNDLDEEIKITKKRKPVAKLDETRLLSTAGIPKLRKISKTKLRFNGKGNEFTDMARLLNTYQLWLDDLFPKAKFLDGLAMVEKLGHKKKIQMYRKEWIDEDKPKSSNYEDDIDDFFASREAQASEQLPWETEAQAQDPFQNAPEMRQVEIERAPIVHGTSGEQDIQAEDDRPDEDELDALLGGPGFQTTTKTSLPGAEDPEPDEDELDALMAEDEHARHVPKSLFGGPSASQSAPATTRPLDSFHDEEEAMAEMDW